MGFRRVLLALIAFVIPTAAGAGTYVNFESSQVHPIALTPNGERLLAVNTPAALLEVFAVEPDGSLVRERVIPVGLEPVSVRARTDGEAWVVANLSDAVNVVDLDDGVVTRTLATGNEPTDVAFAGGKAFVSVFGEDTVEVRDLADLDAAPTVVPIFGRNPRALAVSGDGSKVYVVVQTSGNGTTTVQRILVDSDQPPVNQTLLGELGLQPFRCETTPPNYPPNPAGIPTNPALEPFDPRPPVALIVKWNPATSRFEDDAGQDWTTCVPFRLPDLDLHVIDVATLGVTSVAGLGTTLFDVSVNPASGKVYVPNTDARNQVRFEHPNGLQGHFVDNRLSIVDPAQGNAVAILDLNSHVNPSSAPPGNAAERQASVSQAGTIAWEPDGAHGWMTAIGSGKVFRLDGTCESGSCLFGPDRADPDAVEVGGGPTGAVVSTTPHRVFVLLRFSNSIAIVDPQTLSKVGEAPLYDPSDLEVREGRHFLYDAEEVSRHGDQSCASCHVSGNFDGLAWDLGNPEGETVPYGEPGDNVRFVQPGTESDCDPANCAGQDGFDPRKGPMLTQTLRGMLEPLHWRGDRPTFDSFDGAFLSLLGDDDGLSPEDMELFRQFALGIRFPPNPHRNLDDTLPDEVRLIPGHPLPGNPAAGAAIFQNTITTRLFRCSQCHRSEFGTTGGKLGGLSPGDPTSDRAALINGTVELAFHNDMKIAHLRNLHERLGPVWGDPASPPAEKVGFGFGHDGGTPNLGVFLALGPFDMTAQQIRDVSMFALHFPTGTKPAVGRQLTLPPGVPPTGSASDESALATLVTLGDGALPQRHCELVASATIGGRRRTWRLFGGTWIPDAATDPAVTLATLRASAESAITFTCGTPGSGARLGLDFDEDGVLNADDCAEADPLAAIAPSPVMGLGPDPGAGLVWSADPAADAYEVLGGTLSTLRADGGIAEIECVGSGLATPSFVDPRPDPVEGDGYYYLVRSRNGCGPGPLGSPGAPPGCP